MTTRKEKSTENKKPQEDDKNNAEKGKQGFASMPKEQVRKIASEGGRHSHDNKKSKKKEDKDNE